MYTDNSVRSDVLVRNKSNRRSTVEITDRPTGLEEFHARNSATKAIQNFETVANDLSMLPGTVANALVRAYEGFSELALTDNARRVFACLIRYGLSLNNPRTKVFIKKGTVASRLNLNEATVYRALALLKKTGLIERDEQTRYKAISTISFTDDALLKLGVVKTKKSARNLKGSDRKSDSPEDCLAPLQAVNSEHIQSFSKRQYAGDNERKRETKKQEVPPELAWLITEKGLTQNGVFGLMGLATKAGHRLSDVLQHAAHAVRSAKVKSVFAYIRTLISKPLDYAFLARRTLETQRVKEAAKRDEDRLVAVEASLEVKIGESYVAPDGKVWTVEQGMFVTENSASTKFSTPYRAERSMMDSISTGAWPKVDRTASTCDFHPPFEAQPISTSEHARRILAGLRSTLRGR